VEFKRKRTKNQKKCLKAIFRLFIDIYISLRNFLWANSNYHFRQFMYTPLRIRIF